VLGSDTMSLLPIAYLGRISGVPGISAVAVFAGFDGQYQDPKNSIPVYATGVESLSSVYPELNVSREQIAAMKGTRTGALVGDQVARKFGWKIGDALPLHASDGKDWTFAIVGIVQHYDADLFNFGNRVIANYEYVSEAGGGGGSNVIAYLVAIDDPARAVPISEAIDRLFANSPHETETRSEKEFAQTVIKQMGDIAYFINAIVAAAFFTLLFLTGTTMWQSIRDRIPEFAVMKTLGFSDGGVMALVVAESLLLYLFGALAGLVTVFIVFPLIPNPDGMTAPVAPAVIVSGLVLAVLLALASGLPPAWRVRRLSVVDALAGR
jgi:putative ABC transport system permease protein